MKKSRNSWGDELEGDGCVMYPISETSFLSKARPKISQEKMMQALLLLKSESDSSMKTYYQADTKYSAFDIDYMLRNR